jgi:outer membrane lipoprotein-sorting protein
MKPRTLLLTGALAILTLSVASAKTYDILLSSPTKAGTLQLKPGEYKMSVNGTKVIFTDVNTTKTFKTDVKVENSDAKFDDTKINTLKDGSSSVIKDIELGGSKTKIDF